MERVLDQLGLQLLQTPVKPKVARLQRLVLLLKEKHFFPKRCRLHEKRRFQGDSIQVLGGLLSQPVGLNHPLHLLPELGVDLVLQGQDQPLGELLDHIYQIFPLAGQDCLLQLVIKLGEQAPQSAFLGELDQPRVVDVARLVSHGLTYQVCQGGYFVLARIWIELIFFDQGSCKLKDVS